MTHASSGGRGNKQTDRQKTEVAFVDVTEESKAGVAWVYGGFEEKLILQCGRGHETFGLPWFNST